MSDCLGYHHVCAALAATSVIHWSRSSCWHGFCKTKVLTTSSNDTLHAQPAGGSAAQHSEAATSAQDSSNHQASQRLQGKSGLSAELAVYAAHAYLPEAATCMTLCMQRDPQGAKPTRQQAAQMVRPFCCENGWRWRAQSISRSSCSLQNVLPALCCNQFLQSHYVLASTGFSFACCPI